MDHERSEQVEKRMRRMKVVQEEGSGGSLEDEEVKLEHSGLQNQSPNVRLRREEEKEGSGLQVCSRYFLVPVLGRSRYPFPGPGNPAAPPPPPPLPPLSPLQAEEPLHIQQEVEPPPHPPCSGPNPLPLPPPFPQNLQTRAEPGPGPCFSDAAGRGPAKENLWSSLEICCCGRAATNSSAWTESPLGAEYRQRRACKFWKDRPVSGPAADG